jgi:Protein of unknown function (DUF1822)
MSINSLLTIYPEHLWVAIAADRPMELPHYYRETLHRYLQNSLGLENQIVDCPEDGLQGFVLEINGIRVGFFPDEAIDLAGFTVNQKWLGDCHLDYYVPVQIEAEHLHLWGFMSDAQFRQAAEFDAKWQEYTVGSESVTAPLDDLWLACELGLGRPKIDALSIQLSAWLRGQNTIHGQDWQSIEEFFQTQIAEIFGSPNHPARFTICPTTELSHMRSSYRSSLAAFENKTPDALADLILSTENQQERWDAIEYLWQVAPQHPALPIYKLLDLGLFFQGQQLTLLISILSLPAVGAASRDENRVGILIRLNASGAPHPLPAGIALSRLDPEGQVTRHITAADDDHLCLQLIFDGDIGDRFSISVTLGERQFTKHFQV